MGSSEWVKYDFFENYFFWNDGIPSSSFARILDCKNCEFAELSDHLIWFFRVKSMSIMRIKFHQPWWFHWLQRFCWLWRFCWSQRVKVLSIAKNWISCQSQFEKNFWWKKFWRCHWQSCTKICTFELVLVHEGCTMENLRNATWAVLRKKYQKVFFSDCCIVVICYLKSWLLQLLKIPRDLHYHCKRIVSKARKTVS